MPTVTAPPTAVTVRVEGKVLDQATQIGIPDVTVSLAEHEPAYQTTARLSVGGGIYTTTTDLDGIYRFPAVNVGTYTLTARKDGVLIETAPLLTLQAGQAVEIEPLVARPAESTVYLPLVTK